MEWLLDLYQSDPTAQAIGLISIVCMAGMLLSTVKVRGIGLGTAGVLFAGILVGAISKPIDAHTLEFVKELGLVIFVFTIGLQLGPGFFASLRGTGVYLNVLAAAIVVLGALLAAALGTLLGFDPASTLGVFSGATTNTPSLGAAQHALSGMPGITQERAALPALAYAVTYPVAIAVMIATMLLLKRCFGLEPRGAAQRLTAEQQRSVEPPERRTILVENVGVEGIPVEAVGGLAGGGVVISRVKRASETHIRVSSDGLVLRRGDLVLAVGTASALDRCE